MTRSECSMIDGVAGPEANPGAQRSERRVVADAAGDGFGALRTRGAVGGTPLGAHPISGRICADPTCVTI